jgi:hypothetical protein
MKLKTEVEMNTCKISNVNLTGCYECEKGAQLDIICETDFGKSLANIVCPSAKLLTTCSPKGTKKIHSVHFSAAQIDEECEVFCGSTSTKFELKGTLAFPEMKDESEWKMAVGPVNLINEFKGFDFKNLLKYLLDPKQLIIWLATILGMFAVFYCSAPIILRLLLRLLMTPFVPRSVVTDVHSKIV